MKLLSVVKKLSNKSMVVEFNFLIALGGIPLTIFQGNNRCLDLATILFGSGLSMALDQWVYLIVTDGSDASYLLPVSLIGGVVMIGLAVIYLLL